MKQITEFYINPLDGTKTIEYSDGTVEVISQVSQDKAYIAPESTGGNDTVLLQTYLNQMSTEALAENKPRVVYLPENQTYNVDGLVHPEYITIDGQGSKLVKVAGYSGNIFTSGTYSIIRAAWIKKGNSWYGSNRNMQLKNIVLDLNNQNYTAGVCYLNVEDFLMENVKVYGGTWSIGWATRIAGKRIRIINCEIYSGSRVYQDGLHIMYGEDIVILGGYYTSGDDAIALGSDAVTSNVYQDDVMLRNVYVAGANVMAIRGSGLKVYTAAVAPFSGAPNNYVNSGTVQGVTAFLSGRSGLLRNNGVALVNHASANNRNLDRISGIKVCADLQVGTDGKSVYSAVAGVVVGTPSAVTKAASAQVTLNNHGLVNGDVVVFTDIPSSGMVQLVNYYQVRNVTTNTFELADNAYRNNVGLDSTSFNTWTTGTVVKASIGSGYTKGDILTLAGGTAITPATFRVTEVGTNGEVRAVNVVNPGDYSVLPSTPNTPTGGTGTGCVLHLELTHSGVGAYGTHAIGVSDSNLEGFYKINDTSGSAARFKTSSIIDSSGITVNMISNVPEDGGIWVTSEATVLKSRDNKILGTYTCGNTIASSAGLVLLGNSMNTEVGGVWDNVPSNATGVRAIIGGNSIESKTISAISTADPSVFTVTAHGRKVGDLVVITGSVLSAGDINNTVYRVRSVVDANNITLRTIDNNNLSIGAVTVTTPGTIALAVNNVYVDRMSIKKNPSATGVVGVNTFSNTPPRASLVSVTNCDFSEVDNPISDTTAQCPIFFSQNNTGFNEPSMTYRSATIDHNAAKASSVIVISPGAAMTINAPTNARKGMRLTYMIKQGATTQTVTWNTVFKKAADGTASANSTGITTFEYDGVNWIQVGGALTYFV